jgi:VRR-NUC domain
MIPTQRQIDLMDPKDREQFPKKIRLTTSERKAANEEKAERYLDKKFSDYLRLRKRIFQFVRANPSKRSTIEPGWPDYTILCKVAIGARIRTIACLIELKAPGGRLTESQIRKFAELETAGLPVYVCTTLKDAIEQLIEYFELPAEAFTND